MNYETNVRGEEFQPVPPELKEFMHRVDIACGNTWVPQSKHDRENSIILPSSINAKCGYCNRQGALTCSRASHSNELLTTTLKAECPYQDCQKSSTVLLVGTVTGYQWAQGQRPAEFWILPKPSFREPKIDTDFIDNSRIAKAYKEAVDSYNENKPSLCISSCGRIVEGVGKINFPESKSVNTIGRLYKTLEKKLEEIPEFDEVLTPFVQLGEALRLGRNPASHFDLEIDPSIELAGKVLDLTEFLLEYIYIIPSESIAVKELIEECGPGDTE